MPTSGGWCAWLRLVCSCAYACMSNYGREDITSLMRHSSAFMDCSLAEFCDVVGTARPGCLLDLVVVSILNSARVCVMPAPLGQGHIVAWLRKGEKQPQHGMWHYDGHFQVVSIPSPSSSDGCVPAHDASEYVPDLTQQGVEPNPGPPAEPETTKATAKQRSRMTTRLLKLGTDLTPHQVRTLVNLHGACERLEAARSDQQCRDILHSLLAKSGFKKEVPGVSDASEHIIQVEGAAELLELGFQCRIDLLPVEKRPDLSGTVEQVRTWALTLLQEHIHPVFLAASTPDIEDTRVVDAVVARTEKGYVAGRVWIKGDLALVLSLSGTSALFYNPPLVMQQLFRVAWVEGDLAAVLEQAKAEPAFAGVVLSKERFGIRRKLPPDSGTSEHLWLIHGVPLRLSSPTVRQILDAVGVTGATIRRESTGWKLTRPNQFPIPPPLEGPESGKKFRVQIGSSADVFQVSFSKPGKRAATSSRHRSGSRRRARSGKGKGKNGTQGGQEVEGQPPMPADPLDDA
eukprot:6484848-Amphidinium_carterae.1